MNFSTALTLTLALTAAWTITSAASQSTKMSKKGKDNKNKPKRDDNTLTRGNSDCIAGGNRTTGKVVKYLWFSNKIQTVWILTYLQTSLVLVVDFALVPVVIVYQLIHECLGQWCGLPCIT